MRYIIKFETKLKIINRIIALKVRLYILEVSPHLAIMTSNVEPTSGRVVFLDNLHPRHEPCDANIVMAVLKSTRYLGQYK